MAAIGNTRKDLPVGVTTLVLTLVGEDRSGLVAAVADVVAAHDGNWEQSQLSELAGTFAGVVQVSVPEARAEELRTALGALDGMLSIAAHPGGGPTEHQHRRFEVSVLGNDRPGIVRDISTVLTRHGLSIEQMSTETRDAAMYGGRLFEAHVSASVPESADPAAVRADLEKLATEIQVDITVD